MHRQALNRIVTTVPCPQLQLLGCTTTLLGSTRSFASLNKRILKGKKASSARWLQRQWSDPFTKKAQREGFRTRASYKLLETCNKFNLIQKGDLVVDLGAAPGGWSQVAANLATRKVTSKNRVIAIDLIKFEDIPGVTQITGDFRKAEVRQKLQEIMREKTANVIISDMAPSLTGNMLADNAAHFQLCENALRFVHGYLKPGGNFAVKLFTGEGQQEFRSEVEKHFFQVKIFKPVASRQESAEIYLVAREYKGRPSN